MGNKEKQRDEEKNEKYQFDIDDESDYKENGKYSNYTEEEIDEEINERLYQVCTELFAYIKGYTREDSLPIAERLEYIDLYDFITNL